METGFEKLFVRRGHPSDEVNDGELFHGVTGSTIKHFVPKSPFDFMSISIYFVLI